MKIIDLEIDPMENCRNNPRLILVVDKLPSSKDLIYKTQEIDDDIMYWAEKDGYVEFVLHVPSDEAGFGGDTFTFTLENGEKVRVKGPWSSRSSVANKYFPHSKECIYYEQGKSRLGGTGGNILISKIKPLIEKFEPDWFLFGYNNRFEIEYNLFPIERKDKLLMVKEFQVLLNILLKAERYTIYSGDHLELLNHYQSKKMITGLTVTKPGVPTIHLYDKDHDITIQIPLESTKIPIIFKKRSQGIDLIIKSENGILTIRFENLDSVKNVSEEQYIGMIEAFIKKFNKFFKLIE